MNPQCTRKLIKSRAAVILREEEGGRDEERKRGKHQVCSAPLRRQIVVRGGTVSLADESPDKRKQLKRI